MQRFILRGAACLLSLAAAVTTACSSSEPTSPAASSAQRAPVGGASHASGYTLAWGRGGDSSGAAGSLRRPGLPGDSTTGGAISTSGYTLAWGSRSATGNQALGH